MFESKAILFSFFVSVYSTKSPNNPFVFKDLDPRTKSRLYPLREISFNPYTDFLAEFTVEKKGDVRIARETLIRAGELARKSGDGKIRVEHIKKNLNKSKHATSRKTLGELSKQERFILRLIPNKGIYYPQLYQFYKSTDGRLGDRMLRNYIERFSKLKLINMERKGVSGSYFITLNMPKDVLFEIS